MRRNPRTSPFGPLRAAKEELFKLLRPTEDQQEKISAILYQMYSRCRVYRSNQERNKQDEHPYTPGFLHQKAFLRKFKIFLRYERRGQWCAVLFADARGFKHINDTYGHLIADQVIAAIAKIFKQHMRSGNDNDLHCRWGERGDEFCFLLTNLKGLEAATTLVNRTKAAIEAYPWVQIIGIDMKVYVDMGTAGFNTKDLAVSKAPIFASAIAESLVSKADKRMLSAKKTGNHMKITSQISSKYHQTRYAASSPTNPIPARKKRQLLQLPALRNFPWKDLPSRT